MEKYLKYKKKYIELIGGSSEFVEKPKYHLSKIWTFLKSVKIPDKKLRRTALKIHIKKNPELGITDLEKFYEDIKKNNVITSETVSNLATCKCMRQDILNMLGLFELSKESEPDSDFESKGYESSSSFSIHTYGNTGVPKDERQYSNQCLWLAIRDGYRAHLNVNLEAPEFCYIKGDEIIKADLTVTNIKNSIKGVIKLETQKVGDERKFTVIVTNKQSDHAPNPDLTLKSILKKGIPIFSTLENFKVVNSTGKSEFFNMKYTREDLSINDNESQVDTIDHMESIQYIADLLDLEVHIWFKSMAAASLQDVISTKAQAALAPSTIIHQIFGVGNSRPIHIWGTGAHFELITRVEGELKDGDNNTLEIPENISKFYKQREQKFVAKTSLVFGTSGTSGTSDSSEEILLRLNIELDKLSEKPTDFETANRFVSQYVSLGSKLPAFQGKLKDEQFMELYLKYSTYDESLEDAKVLINSVKEQQYGGLYRKYKLNYTFKI